MNRKVGWRRKSAVKAALDRQDDFHEFGGFRLRKFPSDCMAAHRLLFRCRPQVIVEMGSAHGASALLMASWAPLIGLEQIISVDIQEVARPVHPQIRFIVGDSSLPQIVRQIHDMVGKRSCALILDSDHNAAHVRKELELYHGLVGKGQALIVEDTLVDVLSFKKFRAGGGPLRALDGFLEKHPEFREAEGVEPYITTNFFGYLVRG